MGKNTRSVSLLANTLDRASKAAHIENAHPPVAAPFRLSCLLIRLLRPQYGGKWRIMDGDIPATVSTEPKQMAPITVGRRDWSTVALCYHLSSHNCWRQPKESGGNERAAARAGAAARTPRSHGHTPAYTNAWAKGNDTAEKGSLTALFPVQKRPASCDDVTACSLPRDPLNDRWRVKW